jgi:hypothetical protein
MKITQKEFELFRIRLGAELSKRALSCEDLAKDTEAKDYLSNFVKTNIIGKESANKIQDISYKLCNMKISKYAQSKEKEMVEFPVINKYIGRLFLGVYFFERIGDKISEVYIEFKNPML